MREIKFRGYCKEELTGSQWITDGFGVFNVDYANGKRETVLMASDGDYNVYEKSVGQYTGVTDIDDKEIFEGDIISFYNDENYIATPTYGVVIYRFNAFMVEHKEMGMEYLGNLDIEEMCIKVIGNIYKNPELLKG